MVYTETGLRVWADAAKSDPSISCTLQGDITLTNESNWSPIGSSSAPYTGTFDGNGHKITGLKIILVTDSTINYIGFFGYVGSSGAVKNLNLENVNIEIDNGNLHNVCYSGAIAGYSEGSIDNCIVSGTLSNSNSRAQLNAGGIVGYVNGGSISDCINMCEISLTSGFWPNIGGITGTAKNITISACQNFGRINLCGESDSCGGGIAGSVQNTTVTSCSSSGSIMGEINVSWSAAGLYLYLGGIAGHANNSSSITDCNIDGCTIKATYFASIQDSIFVENFVGNMKTVDPSNTGEADIQKNPHSAST